MSFGINGPDNHIPAIQKSHQTNDGGAGNLGYFNQRKKQQEEEKQDSFESSEQEDRSELLLEELDSIGTRIKNFWRIFKSGLNEKNEEAGQDKKEKQDENENSQEQDENPYLSNIIEDFPDLEEEQKNPEE